MKGNSSFNGGVSLNSNVGIGIGVAKVENSTDAGTKITRSSSFIDYNAYLSVDNSLEIPKNVTISKIKTLIQTLQTKKK